VPVEAQDLTVFVQSVMEQMVREPHWKLDQSTKERARRGAEGVSNGNASHCVIHWFVILLGMLCRSPNSLVIQTASQMHHHEYFTDGCCRCLTTSPRSLCGFPPPSPPIEPNSWARQRCSKIGLAKCRTPSSAEWTRWVAASTTWRSPSRISWYRWGSWLTSCVFFLLTVDPDALCYFSNCCSECHVWPFSLQGRGMRTCNGSCCIAICCSALRNWAPSCCSYVSCDPALKWVIPDLYNVLQGRTFPRIHFHPPRRRSNPWTTLLPKGVVEMQMQNHQQTHDHARKDRCLLLDRLYISPETVCRTVLFSSIPPGPS